MIIAGIDPGVTGGIATLSAGNVFATDLPVSDGELDVAGVAGLLDRADILFLEVAHAMPAQGVSSTFKFGQAYGTIIGVAAAIRVPTYRVAAATWKRELGLPAAPPQLTASQKTTYRKAQSIDAANEIWPEFRGLWPRKKHNHRAEAALIAHWGARHRQFLLGKRNVLH
jgi:hypothetical protein